MPDLVIVPDRHRQHRLGGRGVPASRQRAGGHRRAGADPPGVACDAAGRRHVRRVDAAPCGSRCRRGVARADPGGPADHGDLRRPPDPVRDQRREPGRARARHRCRPCRQLPRGRAGAAVRLERGRGRRGLRPAGQRLRLLRQQLSRGGGTRLEGGDGRAWRPLRRGHGARQHRRLPVPPRAVRRLRRGLAVALAGAADADLAHHPLPRRQPRPRGQGRALSGTARRRRSGRAGDALPGSRVRTRSSSSTCRRRRRAGATSWKRCGGCGPGCRSR